MAIFDKPDGLFVRLGWHMQGHIFNLEASSMCHETSILHPGYQNVPPEVLTEKPLKTHMQPEQGAARLLDEPLVVEHVPQDGQEDRSEWGLQEDLQGFTRVLHCVTRNVSFDISCTWMHICWHSLHFSLPYRP